MISLEGEEGERDEEGRKLYNGNMIIWAGKGSITERYFMQSNFLEWRVRGRTSAEQEKNQWKLTMKNENGENMNLELLGMGSDDDWILNSLVFDDTKVREKLFMDTWNEVASKSEHNYKMSTGEYVEVIINGEYMGVYLLQRRLDKKYLELMDEDVLLKVTTYQAENAEEAYELVTEVEDVEKVYSHMQKIYEGSDCSSIDANNLADINNMLYLTNAVDNGGLKNMYMVLENESNMYKIFFVPWDTDMILGLDWDGHIIYDYERTMEYFSCRMETTAVKNNNLSYDKIAEDRWNYLKKSTLSVEELTDKVDTYTATLESSGALQRDKDKWGERYNGKDTVQNMKKYISERFDMLEYYYCQ